MGAATGGLGGAFMGIGGLIKGAQAAGKKRPSGSGYGSGVGLTQGNNASRDAIMGQMNRMSDPNYGLQQYMQLAGVSTPGLDTFLGMNAQAGATGRGRSLMAQEQFEASSRRASADAFQQFGQFNLGVQTQSIPALLQLLEENQQFGTQAQMFERQDERNRRANRNNAWISGGLNLLGNIGGAYFGNRFSNPAQ